MPAIRSPGPRRNRADSSLFSAIASANVSENDDVMPLRPSSRQQKSSDDLVNKCWELEGRVAVLFRQNEALREEKRLLEDASETLSLNHAGEMEALGRQFESRVAELICERVEAQDEVAALRERLAEAENRALAHREAESKSFEDGVAALAAMETKHAQLALDLGAANAAKAEVDKQLLDARSARYELDAACEYLRARVHELQKPSPRLTAVAVATGASAAMPSSSPNVSFARSMADAPSPLASSIVARQRRERAKLATVSPRSSPPLPRGVSLLATPAAASPFAVLRQAARASSDVEALQARTRELEAALLLEREARLREQEAERAREEMRLQREDLARAKALNRQRALVSPPSFMHGTVSSEQRRHRR